MWEYRTAAMTTNRRHVHDTTRLFGTNGVRRHIESDTRHYGMVRWSKQGRERIPDAGSTAERSAGKELECFRTRGAVKQLASLVCSESLDWLLTLAEILVGDAELEL